VSGLIFLEQYGGMGGGQVVLVELLRRLSPAAPCTVLAPDGRLHEVIHATCAGVTTGAWQPSSRGGSLRLLAAAAAGPRCVLVVNGQRALLPALGVKLWRRVRWHQTHIVLIAHSMPATAVRRVVLRTASRWCDTRILVARCLRPAVAAPALPLSLGVRPADLPADDVVAPLRSRPRVKAMGRCDPVKGLHLFPAAVRLLRDSGRCEAVEFLLAVSPSLESPGRDVVVEGDDVVEVVGPRSMDWVDPDDVLVVPSLSEAACLTAQEAMARGALVVAAEVGDVPEFVEDGRTGFLFRAGDPADLADAVARAMALTAAERVAMRAAARAAVEHRAGPWYDAVVDLLTELASEAEAVSA
jgi:hypothetical protein